ncbi:hypothetical protein MTR67_023628 [Solanum verrucosum]|uniref:Uncharacterized protein n=1 Tax=Solanum verrucosum TaxID=315347 RepID=A0AAF0QXH8_SOLVR|nr:hypothetical protein MTR67_023628 [Solanum verrucosum]
MDANKKNGIDSMLPTSQLHGSVVVPIPSVTPKVFYNKQSKDANNKQVWRCERGIDLRAPSTTIYQAHMIQGNINNKINMTIHNDTENLSPVLIEDIDPGTEDFVDYESMEGPELGHNDDEGEVKSGRVEVNALFQQEKRNPVYK